MWNLRNSLRLCRIPLCALLMVGWLHGDHLTPDPWLFAPAMASARAQALIPDCLCPLVTYFLGSGLVARHVATWSVYVCGVPCRHTLTHTYRNTHTDIRKYIMRHLIKTMCSTCRLKWKSIFTVCFCSLFLELSERLCVCLCVCSGWLRICVWVCGWVI